MGAFVWWQYNKLISLRAAMLFQQRTVNLQHALLSGEHFREDAQRKLDEIQAKRTETSDATPSMSMAAYIANDSARLAHDPDYAQYNKTRQNLFIQRKYAKLFDELNLPPDKLEKFKELLADLLDVKEQAVTDPSNSSLHAVKQAIRSQSAQINQEISNLLGPAGYQEYNDYNGMLSAQNEVNEITTEMAFEGISPLNADQQDALAHLLHEVDNPRKNPQAKAPPDPQSGLTPADQELLASAAANLQPEQVRAIGSYLADNHEKQAISKQLLRNKAPSANVAPKKP